MISSIKSLVSRKIARHDRVDKERDQIALIYASIPYMFKIHQPLINEKSRALS